MDNWWEKVCCLQLRYYRLENTFLVDSCNVVEFICTGEMGEYSFQDNPRCIGYLFHQCECFLGEDTKPAHAGINFKMQ